MVKKVLFACVKNAGRSQIACAAFNSLVDPSDAVAISAGTEPADSVHPCVFDAMLEMGIDLSDAKPTKLTPELASSVDILVTMGCGEKCPYVPGLKVVAWNIEDPNHKPVEDVRRIRGIIYDEVSKLIQEEKWRLVSKDEMASGSKKQHKIYCKKHELSTLDNVQVQCGLNETCVPGFYDEECLGVYCEVPESLSPAYSEGVVIHNDGDFICKITHEGMKSDSKRPCVCKKDPAVDQQVADQEAFSVLKQLSWIDKLLPVWIIGAMVLGVLLGYYIPAVSEHLQVTEIAGVSLPIAVGLWMMMWPVLTKVHYELLNVTVLSRSFGKQFLISFTLNWLVGPFLMCGLAWMCLPDLPTFRNGVIMVGLARCIAMVLIWNQLAVGDPELCAILVAFNSVLQIILYSPLTVFFLEVVSGSTGVGFSFWPVARSVLLFLGVPLVAGILLRYSLIAATSRKWVDDWFCPKFGLLALLALVYTIIVMFAIQGNKIVNEIGDVARVSVPMLLYFGIMFFGTLFICWKSRTPYGFAVTQAFTASSNNFELAIAVAIATFGVESDEALAATVGPLIEVPALLSLVYVALWIKNKWWRAYDEELKAQGLISLTLVQVPVEPQVK